MPSDSKKTTGQPGDLAAIGIEKEISAALPQSFLLMTTLFSSMMKLRGRQRGSKNRSVTFFSAFG
jgi:hypothetical protein